MQLRVNGEDRELVHGATIAELLAKLGMASDGVAVAVNTHVVPRGEHAGHTLQEGDRVEVIRAVGGG